jgi:hypothetical protein
VAEFGSVQENRVTVGSSRKLLDPASHPIKGAAMSTAQARSAVKQALLEKLHLLHLYRARSASHEGDCFYKDYQTRKDVYCDISHAERFFAAARAFTYWIDSQA